MLRDVDGAGEDGRPAARPPSLVARDYKNQCFRADAQQRVILAAVRWLDADSTVSEHEALAKLLKGRTGYALGVWSNVGLQRVQLASVMMLRVIFVCVSGKLVRNPTARRLFGPLNCFCCAACDHACYMRTED